MSGMLSDIPLDALKSQFRVSMEQEMANIYHHNKMKLKSVESELFDKIDQYNELLAYNLDKGLVHELSHQIEELKGKYARFLLV